MQRLKAICLVLLQCAFVANAFLVTPQYGTTHKFSNALLKPAGGLRIIPASARSPLRTISMKSDDQTSPSSDEELKRELEVIYFVNGRHASRVITGMRG
jgi:hypothetical protein